MLFASVHDTLHRRTLQETQASLSCVWQTDRHLRPVSRQVHRVSLKARLSASAPCSELLLAMTGFTMTGFTSSMNTSHSSYCHQLYSACRAQHTHHAAPPCLAPACTVAKPALCHLPSNGILHNETLQCWS